MSCTTTGVVTFSYVGWSARYPELAAWVSSALGQEFFNEACAYLDNSQCSPVCDVNVRGTYLNMLTAHIAAMNAPINGAPSSPLVGRVSTAGQGSVSVSTTFVEAKNGTEAWYQQTKYGAAYWTATAAYRLGQYVPGAQPNFEPWGSPFGYNGFVSPIAGGNWPCQ